MLVFKYKPEESYAPNSPISTVLHKPPLKVFPQLPMRSWVKILTIFKYNYKILGHQWHSFKMMWLGWWSTSKHVRLWSVWLPGSFPPWWGRRRRSRLLAGQRCWGCCSHASRSHGRSAAGRSASLGNKRTIKKSIKLTSETIQLSAFQWPSVRFCFTSEVQVPDHLLQ